MIAIRFFSILFMYNSFVCSQYTNQINSNRPGESIGAYAVGKRVVQTEMGFGYRQYSHSSYNNSSFSGEIGFLNLRWGFLSEQLELTLNSVYLNGKLNSKITSDSKIITKRGFLNNSLGIKLLLFDPFKKERTINFYSWKANNGFKIRDLIPAVSLTIGGSFSQKNNPFPYNNVFGGIYRSLLFGNINAKPDEEPYFHLRGTLATQSHFLGTWVLVTNLNYDRYLSDYPEMSYFLTLTHTLSPYWSIFIENQGFKSDLFQDTIYRFGAAYLYSNNMQLEASLGASSKNTPSLLLANVGLSYRLDFHKDFTSSEEMEQKSLKEETRNLKKTLKKNPQIKKKRNRKAKKNIK